jgi:hypothetical protein
VRFTRKELMKTHWNDTLGHDAIFRDKKPNHQKGKTHGRNALIKSDV